MDRDMALPTAMTIFNRSTINLENEIEVIKSNRIIKSVVENLDLNIKFYTVGRLKTTQYHPSEWLYNIRHNFKKNFSNENWFTINEYLIEITENGLNIKISVNGDESEEIIIEGYDTSIEYNRLPFILSLNPVDVKSIYGRNLKIVIEPVDYTASNVKAKLSIIPIGKSDLLSLSYSDTNINC